ncbi:hypothetical protein Tco_0520474 [Tanacetum coccineum]
MAAASSGGDEMGDDDEEEMMVCRGDGSGGGVVMVVAATKVGWRWRRLMKMVFGGREVMVSGGDGVNGWWPEGVCVGSGWPEVARIWSKNGKRGNGGYVIMGKP